MHKYQKLLKTCVVFMVFFHFLVNMYEFGLGLTCDIRIKPQVLRRWKLKECRRGVAVSAFGCFFGVTAHANMETIAIYCNTGSIH